MAFSVRQGKERQWVVELERRVGEEDEWQIKGLHHV